MVYMPVFSISAAILLWLAASPGRRDRLESEWQAPAVPAASAVPARIGGLAARTVLSLLVAFVILRSWVSVGESSFIPLYFTGVRHLNPTYAGLMISLFLGAGSVGTILGGMAADQWGRRRMLVISTIILPPLLWLMPRAEGPAGLIAALVAGMAAVSTFAVVMVMAQSIIPHRIGLISGLIIGFAVGTGGIGATLLGAAADRWGVLRALDITAVLPLAALTIALLLPPDPPGVRNSNVAPPRTSMSGTHANVAGG